MQKLISLQADKYTMTKYTSAELQRTQRPEKRREGQGALTRSRCAADETVVTTRVPTGGQGDENDSLVTVFLLEMVLSSFGFGVTHLSATNKDRDGV
jgi:hypothetical protein